MHSLHTNPLQKPDNISFDEAATIPLCLSTAAIGLYDSPREGSYGVGLTPPWEPNGAGKYKDQGILVVGGSSCVGQFG
jgi:NADPH:quinone reductase-like Zn-dependent oxidoreductase